MKDLKKLVVDTNQFILRFGSLENSASKILLNKFPELASSIAIHIPQTVVKEVRNNLSPPRFKEFINFIHAVGTVDEDALVPVELAVKYASLGLKPADSFIAAYTDWIQADILVSENRHFLSRQTNLPFKVVTAARCLLILSKEK